MKQLVLCAFLLSIFFILSATLGCKEKDSNLDNSALDGGSILDGGLQLPNTDHMPSNQLMSNCAISDNLVGKWTWNQTAVTNLNIKITLKLNADGSCLYQNNEFITLCYWCVNEKDLNNILHIQYVNYWQENSSGQTFKSISFVWLNRDTLVSSGLLKSYELGSFGGEYFINVSQSATTQKWYLYISEISQTSWSYGKYYNGISQTDTFVIDGANFTWTSNIIYYGHKTGEKETISGTVTVDENKKLVITPLFKNGNPLLPEDQHAQYWGYFLENKKILAYGRYQEKVDYWSRN